MVVGLLVGGCGGGGGGGGGDRVSPSDRPDRPAPPARTSLRTSSIRTRCAPTRSTSPPDEWNSIQAEFHDLGDPDREGQRLRSRASGHLPHGRRDGGRRHVQAARPVVLGADGHVRRRRARRCSSTSRFTSAIRWGSSTASEAGVRHDRDDLTFLHERLAHNWLRQSGSPPAAPPARTSRSTAASTACSSPRRPRKARARGLLSRQPRRRSVKGGRQPETNKIARRERPEGVQEADRYRRRGAIVDVDPSLSRSGRARR